MRFVVLLSGLTFAVGCSGSEPGDSDGQAGVFNGSGSGGAPAGGGANGGSSATSAGGSAVPAGGSTSASGANGGIGGGGAPNAGGTLASAGKGGGPSSGGTTSGGGPIGGGGAGTSGGGAATAGTSGGGAAIAGTSSGGAGGGGSHPCDGTTGGYDVVVALDGTTWTAKRGATSLYKGSDMAAAMQAGLNGLTANRTTKESVLVQGSGNVPASTRVSLGSYTILNVCGTIHVTGSGSGDMAPIYARGRRDIDIPNVKITGSPVYGMFFRDVDNLYLGRIDLRMSSGLGIRIDNNAGSVKRQNVKIDHVYGEGMSSHIVETYGIDQVTIGTVEGKDVGECGLLLNNTTNAEIGLVSCDNCAEGTGYAAFRIANNAGKIGNDWPAGNIRVGKVYARRGGRGIFSVSGSGGLTIDEIDIADTGNNAILLQNCVNTTIAERSGSVSRGSVLLSNDAENTPRFEPSRNVTLKNLTLSNGATLSEGYCELGDRGNRASNISGATPRLCFAD